RSHVRRRRSQPRAPTSTGVFAIGPPPNRRSPRFPMIPLQLEGKSCVVTGGGSGIGRGIAIAFARAGAAVAVTGRRADPLRETVATIEAAGGRATWIEMDVGDPDNVDQGMLELARRLGGSIGVLVANAGIGGPNACSTDGPDRWREILRTNLDGVFHCSRAALRLMPDGGRILVISSV